ncbi:hypothetical protein [Tenacibaculum amylolyticum]|uniref:hypothetical protein n=1 Tax=Tenacibaculum amylolyticum TaxID=104269 RepID=UPI00389470B6
MKKTILSSILFIFFLSVNAQKKEIDSNYINYFQNTREVPFLHLNKTTFLQGEEVWFKAYVQEQNSQKLHPTTSNLYVSIFDESGKLKDQQLIHIQNGMGNGNILLDSTYTNNNYYIKASTRWMKNYKEDNAFYQRIKIASTKQQNNIIATEKEFFEFKLFPEGGHIIANTINNIGILIKDANNKGVQIEKGVIKNQNGKIVRQFVTNKFGMNNIRLFFKENESYTFHAILSNGSEIKTQTPKPERLGIALIVNNKIPEKLAINLVSNIQTLKMLSGKQYNILIHNTRSFKNFPVTFNSKNLNHVLVLQKGQLEPGIQIITVFDENNIPVAERLIYLYSDNLFTSFNVSSKKVGNDSLQINFTNPTNEKIYASASFLPSTTIANKPKNNIISTFLLQPYVKGNIQNPSEYFKGNSKKQQRDLDLLLLTQGWSKYKWNHIFNNSPSIKYAFENGIDITGKVNKKLSSKQSILIYSQENNLLRTINSSENPWTLKNSFIKKNSVVDFSIHTKENLTKIAPALSYSTGTLVDKLNFNQIANTKYISKDISNFTPLKNNFETLNEVEVKAKKKKNQIHKDYIEAGGYRNINMKDIIVHSGENLVDFMLSKTPPSRRISRVQLNGRDISREPWLLENVYLDQVKSMYFGSDMFSLGPAGYAFFIFTYSPNEYNSKKSSMMQVKIPIGFATAKEYYNPKYPSYTDTTYQKYGAIFWNPNISIAPNGKLDFNIPTNMQKNITMYIEGISISGKLISKQVTLKTK